MQLYIIRHGQSFNNALWAKTGNYNGRLADPHLTELGEKQAYCLGQYIAQADQNGKPGVAIDQHNRFGYHFTHLYTSFMLRAVQTGHAIASALDLPLIPWECIHERGGIYLDDPETGEPISLPGGNRAFFAERFPRLVIPDWLQEQGWWHARPYEQRVESVNRARKFLKELIERHGNTDDRVAIITHGGFIYMLQYVIFRPEKSECTLVEDAAHTWLCTSNTSVSRIDFENNRLIQTYMNRVDHLPTEIIT
ncbi:MAG: hypothetical protein CSA11_09740 [Chloroflexi bacterium]|nr:MAG: hypothetical protein CSB13_08860 [Chloroflexota bacterium]PIE80032.1 MAG: hypothetical protein CSA11_09740 [Chloroflexota bacterium]